MGTIDTSPMMIYDGSARDERGIDLTTMRMKDLPGKSGSTLLWAS